LVCHVVQSLQLLHTTTFVSYVHTWLNCLGGWRKTFKMH
jgi:hypothetical protein